MEQSRKNLKTYSIIVLALAILALIEMVFELFFGEINNAQIPEGAPENILMITKIVLAAITLLLYLPQIYIGIKGISVAKNPDSSKAHITLGMILFVLTAVSLISPAMAIIRLEDVFGNVARFLSVAVDAAILFCYVKYAKIVSKAN